MLVRVDPLDNASHMEGTELIHNPTVSDIDLLEMKLTVVGIEGENLISFSLLARKPLDEI